MYKYKMGRGLEMRSIINKLEEIENNVNSKVVLREDVVAVIAGPDVKYTVMGSVIVGEGVTEEDIDRQIDEMCEKAWGHFDDNGN